MKTIVNNAVLSLKVAKRLNPESYHRKKKICNHVEMDVN